MKKFFQRILPILIVVVMFVVLSYVVRTNEAALKSALSGNNTFLGMTLFIIITLATVVIPMASILPFLPAAVLLWGWQVTALLTWSAWVVGGQFLFEISRSFGRPFILRRISKQRLDDIEKVVKGKGLVRGIMVRLFVHEDIVSYGFGMFTSMTSWEFFLINAIGVAPGALFYSYFGSLPVYYQVGMALAGILAISLYMTVERKWPKLMGAE